MKRIHTADGYIELKDTGNIWVGSQAHSIMSAFYKVCRELSIIPNNHNLEVLAPEVVKQLNSNF
jgi:hypothetical protein